MVFYAFVFVISIGIVAAGLSFFPAYRNFFKARQLAAIESSVEFDLKNIQKAELAFHTVHGRYTTDLLILGVIPKVALYKFGFVASSAPVPAGVEKEDPARKDYDEVRKAGVEIQYSPVTKLDQIAIHDLIRFCPDCTATQDRFKIMAVADLPGASRDASHLDIWTIDERGVVVHSAQ
jgi:hypothetical protein